MLVGEIRVAYPSFKEMCNSEIAFDVVSFSGESGAVFISRNGVEEALL